MATPGPALHHGCRKSSEAVVAQIHIEGIRPLHGESANPCTRSPPRQYFTGSAQTASMEMNVDLAKISAIDS